MKTVLKILGLLILLALAAVGGYLFIETGEETHQPMDLIPTDFIYTVESDRPIRDWQDMSQSDVWQYLKGNELFADITGMADYLDSLLEANQTLVDFVRLGEMAISAHMTDSKNYDFLIAVDLKGKGRKLTKLKPVMVELFAGLGYEVSTDEYFNIDVYKLYDAANKETLTLSIVKNVLVASYTEKLVREAIIQSEKESILSIPDLDRVRKRTDRDELYTIYVNYDLLDEYLGIYMTETPEMMADLPTILAYSAFDLDLADEHLKMTGFVKQNDSSASWLTVYKDVGTGRSHAENVLPGTTALYTSVGFDKFGELYQAFASQYEATDPAGFKTLKLAQNQLEKRLEIEFEREFFQWMTDEIITAVVPTSQPGEEYAYYALMHFDDPTLTKERLDYVMKKVSRTFVRFKEYDYQGFQINYMKVKGLFNLFFKKFFSNIETPYFTYVDDYVVFSNDTTALHFIIDEYLNERVLRNQLGYNDFRDRFGNQHSVFTYIQNETFYPYLRSTLDYETRRDLEKNKAYLLSFPHFGMELKPNGEMYEVLMEGEFRKPVEN